MAKSTAVVSPNLGLFLDRPSIALNPRQLQAGENFRIKEGKLSNLNLGWARFSTFTLNGAVLLVSDFKKRDGSDILIFGTKYDLYKYNPASTGSVSFITPIYAEGTAAASGTAVTGTATNWDPEAKAGDEIHFGSATYTDPTGTWYTIQSRTDDTHLVLTASAGTVADGPYTIRKKFTGAENNVWIDDTFVNAGPSNEDEWWATNGINVPVKWNGTTAQVVSQDALGFTCKTLAVFENMMIFGNLVQGGTAKPTDIINSNPGTPSDVTTGLSEQFKVHGGADEILTMLPIGSNLAIYSKLTVTMVAFVGDPLIFVFRNAISGIGALSARAVADYGNYHVFLGRGSQYKFDGASVTGIGGQVWRDTLRQQDPVRVQNIFCHFDDENGDLVWSVPLTTDSGAGTITSAPAKAIAEHYLEQVPPQAPTPASRRDFPFTAAGYYTRQAGTTWDTLTDVWSSYNFRWNDQFFFATFPLTLVGGANGKIYSYASAQDADGAALASYVRFGRTALGDGRTRGLLSRIYPFVSAFANALKVTVRLADHAQGTVTITHTDSFDQSLPEGGHFTTPYRRGRFMELQFGTDGPAQPWELSGYDTDVRSGGKR